LITVGTRRSVIYRMFLTKAVVLGLTGGIAGYILGTASAMILSPYLAGLGVTPIPIYLALSILVAVIIALVGSVLPVRRAARFDPAVIMQEV